MRTFLFFVAAFLFFNCSNKNPSLQFQILERQALEGVPSASGVDVYNSQVLVISDDSPWLFIFDSTFLSVQKVPIWDSSSMVNNRIPKNIKPDFEASTIVAYGKDSLLLIFGSGSGAVRSSLIVYDLSDNITKTYRLKNFYEKLKNIGGLEDDQLNLEAAISDNQNIYLFNRGENIIFKLPIIEFMEYLKDSSGSHFGETESYNFILPSINEVKTGFSGAAISRDRSKIIFTASAENSDGWVKDGEVFGSIIGVIELSDLKNQTPLISGINEEGKPIKIKVESVAVSEDDGNGYSLLLVSDNDLGQSEIIKAKLKVEDQ